MALSRRDHAAGIQPDLNRWIAFMHWSSGWQPRQRSRGDNRTGIPFQASSKCRTEQDVRIRQFGNYRRRRRNSRLGLDDIGIGHAAVIGARTVPTRARGSLRPGRTWPAVQARRSPVEIGIAIDCRPPAGNRVKLADFHAVEPEIPAEPGRAERRGFTIVLDEAHVVFAQRMPKRPQAGEGREPGVRRRGLRSHDLVENAAAGGISRHSANSVGDARAGP